MGDVFNKPLVRRSAMIAATVMTVVYLTYRGLYTMNFSGPYATVASVVLYGAEAYGGLLMFLFFFQIWDISNPEPAPPLPGRTVDVMIPTYNEDPSLLRGTIAASLRIAYPHRTLVLDDGKRPEVAALCEELGAEYVTRPSNLHAKAGNLNHALEKTEGEFVVIFDADHVAETHFIDRLVGYFADDRLGFVQTPHAFYNFDAYQGVLDYKRKVYWEEGMLFYNVTQPGKNRWNGVTFCGSAAMFRRKSLEEVGLIATQSITEDMHTGLRMHAKGWKSLFVNERLIAAIAADDVTSFNTQRLRWGEGNLGIFAFDNPITIRGLTIAQRLCYLGSMLSWTTGVQKLLIYATPIAMLMTGISPVHRMSWQLLAITVLYLITIWSAVKISCNGYGRLLAIELTQMACYWTQVRSTWRALFKRKRATFVVTAKRGRQSNGILKHLAPQIYLIAISAFAVAWAVTKYCLSISNDPVQLIVGGALVGVNCYMAWLVIQRALRSKDRRTAWRHPIALHVEYRGTDESGVDFSGQCVTRDINEGGVGLVAYEPFPPCGEVEMTILAAGRGVTCRGAIRHRREEVKLRAARGGTTQAYAYGIEFVEPTKEQLEVLWWLGAQFAVSFHYERFQGGQFGLGSAAPRRLPTRTNELPFEFPVRVHHGAEEPVYAVTECLSTESVVLLMPDGFQPTDLVRLEFSTPFGKLEAWAEITCAKSRTIAGERVQETRLALRKFCGESRSLLHSVLGHHDSKALAGVIRSIPRRRVVKTKRPMALVVGTTGAAAAVAAGCVLYFQQEQALLARAYAGRKVSPLQVEQLSQAANALESLGTTDEERLLQLRKVMVDLDRVEDVAKIDDYVSSMTPKTLEGLGLKAGSLQRLHRESEAELAFEKLLTHLDQLPDQAMQRDVLLAAARNAAQLENFSESVARFERLEKLAPLACEARLEFAGVLYRDGRLDEAVATLRSGEQSTKELLFLASLYSSEKQFARAANVCREALDKSPDDLSAMRGIADNSYWGQDWPAAATAYRQVLKRTPHDAKVAETLAEVLLSEREFDESLALYSRLVTRFPERRDLWNGYLIAAAKCERLDGQQQKQLMAIYDQRSQDDDNRFLTNLLNAVAKHGSPQEAIPLMQFLVNRDPQDAELRLRLADGLHQAKQFKAADIHYRWLLAHASPQSLPGEPASRVGRAMGNLTHSPMSKAAASR
jgi:cellulose synthase/poly-beta-1,6-N-acetylglucosamine synthase-like glycosyltransferase/tetratricopeptide (TPR) repeat protein